MSKITIDRKVIEQALEALIAYEVKVDSEWGMGRSIEQIDAAGDTPSEISALREALVQPQPAQEPTPLFPPGGAGVFLERPQVQPLTVEQIWENDAIMSLNADAGLSLTMLEKIVRIVEASHGITEGTT